MTDLSALAFSGAAVVMTALVTVSFHSWLRQRERERLSSVAEAKIHDRFQALERWQNEVKNTLANLPRR